MALISHTGIRFSFDGVNCFFRIEIQMFDSLSDKSLNLISDSTPGYDPQQDNYVESMMWTLDASEPVSFRVDASINMDGQVNRQYSLFEKVE